MKKLDVMFSSAEGAGWAWRDDQSQWVAYAPALNLALEESFALGLPFFTFTSPEGRKYRVDFGAMTQTNLATHGPRPVRRSLSPFVASLKLPSTPIRVLAKPTPYCTSTTAKFGVPDKEGQELRPGQCMLFVIPEVYRVALVRSVTLAHRKATKYTSTVNKEGWDSEPAYTTVTAIKGDSGRYVWRDSYGSSKFAEPREANDPEYENLHDWPYYVGNVCMDALLVTNVGRSEHTNAVVNVHSIEVEFFPHGEVSQVQEEIFTPGTRFITLPPSRALPRYGGGQESGMSISEIVERGLYPGAVAIGPSSAAGQCLRIRLRPGLKLGGVEVACGDTFFDPSQPAEEQKNKDKHYGMLGWAKLYVYLHNPAAEPSKARHYLLYNANVPPSGVLSGGPKTRGHLTLEGDELVVESLHFRTWVMAYRVVYLK